MNQNSCEKDRNSVKKDFYKFLNNWNLGYDRRNNIKL